MTKRLRQFVTVFLLSGIIVGIIGGIALANGDYGAIATSNSGAWGLAAGYSSRDEATQEALDQCGQRGCAVQTVFENACGAIAKDSNDNLGWGTSTDSDDVKNRALKDCGNSDCKVVAWDCTYNHSS